MAIIPIPTRAMYWPNGHTLQNGKLIVESVLGQGGFGITYKALHRGFNSPVVIKTPNASLRKDPDYAKFVQRFIREAQILAQLESDPNPHIVRVKDLFEEAGAHCLVMEFIEGKNLYIRVQEEGALSEQTALALICPIAKALAQVHRAGIVHRDVTPVNIMLRGNGQPVLIDFGIAGNVVPTSRSSTQIFGNRAFAPYEQLIKGDRSPTVDIYTLAASLYYAVTGQFPTDCFSRKVEGDELVPPKDLASVSDFVNDAIMAGMALNKSDRPQSMEEWLELLEPPPKQQGGGNATLSSLNITPFSFEVVTVNERGQEISRHSSQAECIIEDLGDGVTLEMVLIPGGTFIMGAPDHEEESFRSERPQHTVTVQPFLMGKYPITQAQWRRVANLPKLQRDLDPDPAYFKGENRPIERVLWYDAIEFCARLAQATGKPYRLPSEAEWEYACRAGTTTPFHFGETLTTDIANYRGIDWEYEGETFPGFYGSGSRGVFREETTPVGHFKVANAFGLYDMHGNVLEWCADPWHDNYNGAPSDGRVWDENNNDYQVYDLDNLVNLLKTTQRRECRGGSCYSGPDDCRCARRGRWHPPFQKGSDFFSGFGFRVSCSVPEIVWDKNKRPQLGTKQSGRGSTPLYLSKPTSFSFEVVKVNERGQEISRHSSQAECIIEDLGNGVTLEMVLIPGGTFMMGSPASEQRWSWYSGEEEPQHRVTIQPFLMGKYPITQAQWRRVANLPKLQRDLDPDPAYFKGDNRPIEQVSWYDVIEFCARLAQATQKPYRLPSEAQWEYACRAGTTTPFHFGETPTSDLANYDRNREETTPVGHFKVANAFGLFDMHGNIYELCADPEHENYNGAPSDGRVWDEKNIYNRYIDNIVNLLDANENRVLRGGSWFSPLECCRCDDRHRYAPGDSGPDIGFRVACSIPEALSP